MLPSVWDSCLWILNYAVTDCHILGGDGDGRSSGGGGGGDVFSTLQWTSPPPPSSSSSSSSFYASTLLSSSPQLSPSHTRQQSTHGERQQLFSRILSLFMTFFQFAVEYREDTIQALVHRCFYTTTQRYSSGLFSECYGSTTSPQQIFLQKVENKIRFERDNNMRLRGGTNKRMFSAQFSSEGHSFLPSVKDCLSSHKAGGGAGWSSSTSSSHCSSVAHQHGIAHVSVCVLEHLVCRHPETHAVLLASLLDKLHPSSSSPSSSCPQESRSCKSTSRRAKQAYDATLLLLPSPLILHR